MPRYDVRIIVNGFYRTSYYCDHVVEAMEYARNELALNENDRVTFAPKLDGRRQTLANGVMNTYQ